MGSILFHQAQLCLCHRSVLETVAPAPTRLAGNVSEPPVPAPPGLPASSSGSGPVTWNVESEELRESDAYAGIPYQNADGTFNV